MNNMIPVIFEQIVVIVIVLVYLSGFMEIPYTEEDSKKFSLENNENQLAIQSDETVIASFIRQYEKKAINPRIVLMVIDALRADHMATAKVPLMPYTDALIRDRKALSYLVHTPTPTVTLPRIKSIVTGSIPAFLDVIFNFHSNKVRENNLINLWNEKGRRIYFYGDETWERLFPNQFHSSRSVVSFYVTDHTQVDNNVTESLTAALNDTSWDVLILHYLGLDHIGHVEGPTSPLIGPKLKEMDDLIQAIHGNLTDKSDPFVFVVCGDHGMSDLGGHGGASREEVLTSAMVAMNHMGANSNWKGGIISPSLVPQVSFASTFALLSHVSIPGGSVGMPLQEVLNSLPARDQLNMNFKSSRHLFAKASLNIIHEKDKLIKLYQAAISSHRIYFEKHKLCFYVNGCNLTKSDVNTIIKLYGRFQMFSSNILIEMDHSYNLTYLFGGMFMLFVITLPNMFLLFFSTRGFSSIPMRSYLVILSVAIVLFLLSIFGILPFEKGTLGLFLIAVYIFEKLRMFGRDFVPNVPKKVSYSLMNFLIFFGCICHPLSLFSTSFVEEEHQTFYYLVSTMHLIIGLMIIRSFLIKYKEKFLSSKGNNLGNDCWKTFSVENHDIMRKRVNDPHIENVTKLVYKTRKVFIFNRRYEIYPPLFNIEKRFKDILHNWHVFWDYDVKIIVELIVRLSLVLICFSLFRFMRSFNSTGDKWKHLRDINDIIRDEGKGALYGVSAIGVCVVYMLYTSYNICALFFLLFALYLHNVGIFGERRGIEEAQFTYYAILVLLLYGIFITFFQTKKSNRLVIFLQYLTACIFLIFLLIQRIENVFVCSLMLVHLCLFVPIVLQNINEFRIHRGCLAVIFLWISYAYYFVLGNSNSLSTVEISSGFVGIDHYSPILHGILISIHTFGIHIIVFLTCIYCLTIEDISVEGILPTWWVLHLVTLSVFVLNVTLQRYHLFIWSVFGPKLLYEGARVIVLFFVTILVSAIQFMFSRNLTCMDEF